MTRTLTITPEAFELVPYDPQAILDVLASVADELGFPEGIALHLEVDEELFNPLTGTAADIADDGVRLWISGANLEDKKRPRVFSVDQSRPDFAAMLVRAADRLSDAFAEAPPESEISRADRAAWDVYAVGRAARLGFHTREQVQRYEFRLQHGFSDAADDAFDRLWAAEAGSLTWSDVQTVATHTGADEREESRVPLDILRQREITKIAPR